MIAFFAESFPIVASALSLFLFALAAWQLKKNLNRKIFVLGIADGMSFLGIILIVLYRIGFVSKEGISSSTVIYILLITLVANTVISIAILANVWKERSKSKKMIGTIILVIQFLTLSYFIGYYYMKCTFDVIT